MYISGLGAVQDTAKSRHKNSCKVEVMRSHCNGEHSLAKKLLSAAVPTAPTRGNARCLSLACASAALAGVQLAYQVVRRSHMFGWPSRLNRVNQQPILTSRTSHP